MKVKLRKLTLDDTTNIIKWRNSKDVRQNLFNQDDLTEEQHLNWYRTKVETGLCAQYIIVAENDIGSNDIGTVFLKGLDMVKKSGEFGIFIGEDLFRGKHLASLATKEMLRIGFNEIGLERIWLSVFDDNIPAIKAYERAGFCIVYDTEEIVRGKRVLMMEINAKDFLDETIETSGILSV